MNKVFKVIWSEARNAYVVVSEIAKNHGSKSCSTKKLLTMLIATGVMTCASMAPAMAGNPAPDDKNVTIGKGAHVSVWNGVSGQTISGDIAIGPNAHAWNGEYTYENAKGSYLPRIGNKEYLLDFGQGAVEAVKDSWKFDFIKKTNYKVADGSKIAGSIAIGKNTIARTGSVMLGDHSYTGKLGDIEIKLADAMTNNNGIYSTTLGAGAYNSGSLAAVTGALSIASGKGDKDTRNTGATIYGSMNSIESATSNSSYSGVALGAGSVADRANAVSVGSVRAERQIINVKAGVEDTDAVNVSQLKDVKAEAGKHTTLVAGDNVQVKEEKTDNGLKYTVSATDTTYTAGNGIAINGDNNAISVKLKAGEGNLVVDKDGLALNKDLQDIASISNGSVKLALDSATGTAGLINGKGASVFLMDDSTVINGVVGIDKNGKISNVANGEISATSKDAVNGSQLHQTNQNVAQNKVDIKNLDNHVTNVEEVAKKHTTVTKGDNIVVTEGLNKDGGKEYKVALDKDISLDSVTTGQTVMNNDGLKVGDKVSVTATAVTAGKTSISDEGVKVGDKTYVSDNGLNANDKKVTNVEAGELSATSKDAVNGSQLHAVATEAGKHTQVKAGTNVGIVPGETEDGTHVYTVNADGTTVSGDSNVVVTAGEKDANNVTNYGVKLNKDLKGIESVSNGSASLTLSSHPIFGATAKLTNGKASVELRDSTAIINGKVQVRQDGSIGGVTAGRVDNDAVNLGQLKDVKAEALKHTTLSDGKNTTVAPTVKDGQTDYKVNVAGDLTDITSVANGGAKIALNGEAGYAGIVNGKGASVFMQGSTTVINGVVGIDQNGKISGVAAGTADTDAVNYGQLKNISAAATAAKTEIKGGTNIANVDQSTADDGHMVYTVNANGTTVSGDSNVAVTAETKDNNVTNYAVKLNKDLQGIESISNNTSKLVLREGWAGMQNGVGASVFMVGGLTTINGKVTVDEQGKISGVAAGVADTDAVNVGQLKDVKAEAGKHTTLSNGKNTTVEAAVKDGQTDYKVNVAGDLTDISSVANGDAKLALNGAAGTAGIVNGKGASVYMQDGYTVINSKVSFDQDGKISGVAAGEISKTSTDAINGSQLNQTNENVAALDKRVTANEEAIKQNADKINKLDNRVTKNEKDIAANRADIDKNKADIAQNKADIAQNKADIKNLDNRVTNVEALAKKHTTVTAGDNITVAETTNADGGKEYKVALNKDISVDSVKAGDTTITDKGLEIKDGPSVTKDGINAGNKKITGVAKGEADTDAVNYGQLKETNNHIDRVENQVVSNTNRINQLGSRVNKVGAGAAALAALHPMDFDPDDKLTFSAGYGNYGGENAAAIGAYYRPDEKVMFSVGGTVGNGENMVNAGVSFSLDRTNHVSNSRTAMAREILDLRAEVTELKAMVAKGGLGSIAEDKMKIFPDVAENHWAYEYVGKLAAAGIIEGYPDGKFSGDRMMSRYEFAAMLYRAMQKGAQLDSKIINEFAPEMGRIRVDRISGEDGDRDKIERVRVNDTKGERDHYGNKLAK